QEAERAIRESEEKFKALFEFSPLGMARVSWEGQLLQVNESFARMIGYTPGEATTLNYWDITPRKYEEQEYLILELVRRHGRFGPFEKEYIHKDGHLVPIVINGMTIRGSDGEDELWGIVEDIKKGANHTAAVNGFVDQFLPHSTHHEITRLVAKGHSNERIAEELHRVDVVGTVLIDICEWGKLNILGSEKISMKAIFRSRVMAFGVFEEIMSRYDFELIKTSGDNMKFSCGLYQAMDNKDSWVAERILKAIPAIMDALYSLNSDLRKEDLPTLEIKIAASMGNTGYGIEKYASRGQFDTQGHFVNVAYRLESAMNSEFYGMFGRNCALIFESVFKASTQASLALKYEHTH
ncbi:MAG: PAS domain S-box protein, partial [Proteobacteria bacterium]